METEFDYGGGKLSVLQIGTAVATSFVICKAGTYLTNLSGIQGGSLPAITAIVVVLATLLPRHFGRLAPAGDAIALVLLQVSRNIWILLPFHHMEADYPRKGFCCLNLKV